MDVFELVAKLVLDTKEYVGGLKEAQGEAEKGGSGIGKALGTAEKVAGAALAATTTAAVAFGKSAVDAGMEFDTSMSQVAATMGYTVDQLSDSNSEAAKTFNELRDFAQEMGSTTAFSASQAADALNYMALAGYDADTSMQMLPTVLDLAAAGSIDLASASDMVTDAQSALGLSLDETSQMVDQMAMTASKSNTSVAQLGEAMLTIGATARGVAGGTTELSTVLGVLADNGIKGAEGGTHLRNMILSLQSPTDKAAEMMEELGIKVYDSDGNMRSLIDIIADLQKSMAGMDQAAKDAVTSTLFNKTDMAAINALIGTSAERYDELTGYIDNAADAAQNMANTQLDNLAGDVTLFKSALEGAQIAISDSLVPTLRGFVKYGADALSSLTEAFKKDGLDGMLDALDGVVDKGIQLLFSVLPTVTKAGLALLEALLNGIVKNLPKLIPAGIEIIKSLIESITKNLPKLMDAAVEIIFALIDGLIDALPELIPAVVQIILTIVEKLTEPNTLMKLIEAAFQIIAAIAQGLINAIPELIKKVPEIMLNLIGAILRFVPQVVASGVELMVQLALGIAEGGLKVIQGVVELLGEIKDKFMERVHAAKEWGEDLIGNFTQGIKNKLGSLWGTIKSIASGIKNFLGFSEPKLGPLSDFHTYAPDMMKLFAQGIKDNEHLITDQIGKSFNFGTTVGNAGMTAGNTTNTFNITVTGVDQLNEIVEWYQSRQVIARMA